MTSCLLSFHGSIVARRGFSLSLASLPDVIAGVVDPVPLTGNGGLMELLPIDPSGGRLLYAVRAGNVFLTAAPERGCGTASQIQGWEQFLALPVARLPELQRLVSRPWHVAAEPFSVLRPAIQDFQLRVGDWAVALETLNVQAQEDGSVLLAGKNASPLRLEPCPSSAVLVLLEDVRNVVRRGDQAPWARIRDSFASLQSEAFKVALYPEVLSRL